MPGVEDDARQTVIRKQDSSDRIDRIDWIDRNHQILFILLSCQRGHSFYLQPSIARVKWPRE